MHKYQSRQDLKTQSHDKPLASARSKDVPKLYISGMHARYKFLSAHCAGLALWVQKSAKLRLMQVPVLRILKTKDAIKNQLKA